MPRLIDTDMDKANHPVEVLSFTNGARSATIVTDGERHKSFEFECVQDHASLHAAIAYLEARGYTIVPDEWLAD